jgi:hypothetical protein
MSACPRCFTRLTPDEASRCPECQYDLPADWVGAHVVTIALIGPRSSGKSVYIAVLARQLKRFFAGLEISFGPASGTDTAEHYAEFYEAVIRQTRNLRPGEGNLVPSTPEDDAKDAHQRQPLVFRIGNGIGPSGRQAFVAFRDTSGETLERLGRGEKTSADMSFLTRADGIISLVDPMHENLVQKLLAGRIPTELAVGDDPRLILDALVKVVGKRPPEELRFAVTVSKFDSLQLLADLTTDTRWQTVMGNPGAAFRRESRPDSLIHRGPDKRLVPGTGVDGKLLHFELESLLYELNHEFWITLREHPWKYRLFAVSALGGMPESGGRKDPRGMAPFRCADPVLWILQSCWRRDGFFPEERAAQRDLPIPSRTRVKRRSRGARSALAKTTTAAKVGLTGLLAWMGFLFVQGEPWVNAVAAAAGLVPWTAEASAPTYAWGASCVALFASLLLSFWKEKIGGILILLSTSACAALIAYRLLFDPNGPGFDWPLPWLVVMLTLPAVVGILCLASPKRPKKSP